MYFFLCVWCFAYIHVCAVYVCSAHGGYKRVADSLKLGFQMAVAQHIGARNQTRVLYKSNKCS